MSVGTGATVSLHPVRLRAHSQFESGPRHFTYSKRVQKPTGVAIRVELA